MSDFKERLSYNLKVRRAMARMNQEQLAEASGVSADTIKGYECGRTSPMLETAYKLASALGCSVNDLCGWGAGGTEAPGEA